MGRYELALEDVTSAITLHPKNAEFFWIKGIIYTMAAGPDANRALLDEAVGAFSTAINMSPNQAKYRASRAKVLRQLDRLVEALADLESAIAMTPDVRTWLS